MTTERKKEGTLVIYGAGKDLTVHQIRFDGSYQPQCSAGYNIVRVRSGFLALFDNADTVVSTLLSLHACLRVSSDCGDRYANCTQIA